MYLRTFLSHFRPKSTFPASMNSSERFHCSMLGRHSSYCLFLSLKIILHLKLQESKLNRAIRFKFSTAGDTICRFGEKADEFYLIKKGRVGVFSADGFLMAILEEGSFFGEIALLLTKKRTMTIKCLIETEFITVPKERMLNILELFPDEKAHLIAIAKQRLKTTSKHDIPLKEVPL